jgi:hypothetical protein
MVGLPCTGTFILLVVMAHLHLRDSPKFLPNQLMQRQEEFFDRAVADLTPTQIRQKLVALAGEVPSIDESKLPAIQDLLTYKGSPNGGNAVTDDVKWFGELLGRLIYSSVSRLSIFPELYVKLILWRRNFQALLTSSLRLIRS